MKKFIEVIDVLPLIDVYRAIYGADPVGLEPIEIVKRTIEMADSISVDKELAKRYLLVVGPMDLPCNTANAFCRAAESILNKKFNSPEEVYFSLIYE